jgi:hypothetical protein
MLQWRELALTVKLTFKEKNSRFSFEKTSLKIQIRTGGISIKNYIDFIKLEKIFI